MKINLSKKELFSLLLNILMILIFTASISIPFLTAYNHDLYIYHLFNPTDITFNGEIYNFYSYPIIAITFVTLILNLIPKFYKNLKCSLIIEAFKTSIFFIYIFVIINYFRIIYPNSFIVDFNTSNLYAGLYLFALFLIMYFLSIIIDIIELNKKIKQYSYLGDLNTNSNKIKKRLIILNRIAVLTVAFSFISLFFVPFIVNYRNYMPEEGFQDILDLRTSVNYYLISTFDSTFSLTIPSILLILCVSGMPLLLLERNDSKSSYKLIITSFFYIILTIFAIIFGVHNMKDITPIIKLDINWISIFFICLGIISSLIIIIDSIIILTLNKKEEDKNADIESI